MGDPNETPAPGIAAVAEAADVARPPRRRRWRRRLLIVLALAAGLYFGRAPILRQVGRFLTVEEPSPATYQVLLLGGDRCVEQAVADYRDGAATAILMLSWHAGRLQQYGIRPKYADVVRQQLRADRVPADALTVIPGDVHSEWEVGRCLRAWLEQHPDAQVVALCHQFATRRYRHILDQTLGAEYAGRVRLRALRHRWYDETKWWRDKDGVKDVFNSYLALAYVYLHGEGTEEWREWSPEQYERTLR